VPALGVVVDDVDVDVVDLVSTAPLEPLATLALVVVVVLLLIILLMNISLMSISAAEALLSKGVESIPVDVAVASTLMLGVLMVVTLVLLLFV